MGDLAKRRRLGRDLRFRKRVHFVETHELAAGGKPWIVFGELLERTVVQSDGT